MIVVRLIVAAIAFVIGIIGAILPILPGWIFFGVSALMLFPNARLARKALAKIEGRFPAAGRMLRKLMET